MGPKDTPFEGGVFAAKLTFVRPNHVSLSFRMFFVLTVSHNQNAAAVRLPTIPFQNEIRTSTLPPQ